MPDHKRLLLLRHAKSSWDDPTLADHDRPLAPRGRRAAKRMGRYLRGEELEVSLVLCSSARRARETLDLVEPGGRTEIDPEVYGASAAALLERVQRVPDEAGTVMLVGHNPAIQDLLVSLVAEPGDLAVQKFPTGALATLTVHGPWRSLEPGQAELAALVTPRQLG
jgi:phosphohistidine phosphatase